MPDSQDHLALADHNQRVIDYLLENPSFPDWVATVAFYKALHLVEALLATDPKHAHGVDHGRRAEILKRTRAYQNIWEHYRPLFNSSLIARYLSNRNGMEFKNFESFMSFEQVKEQLLNHRLKRVEDSVRKLLQKRGKKPRS